jgi:epoxyqueuosine reductase QueG
MAIDRPKEYYCDKCGRMEYEYDNPMNAVEVNGNLISVCDDCFMDIPDSNILNGEIEEC